MNQCRVKSDCLLDCEDGQTFMTLYDRLDNLPPFLDDQLQSCYEKQKQLILKKWTRAGDISTDAIETPCQENPFELQRFLKESKLGEETLRDLMQQVLKWINGVRFIKILGDGSNIHGLVFLVCNPTISHQQVVLKYNMDQNKSASDMFEHEFTALTKFYQHGLAPKPIGINKDRTLLAMGKVDLVLGPFLAKTRLQHDDLDQILGYVYTLLRKLKRAGMTHGDFHWGNIGIVRQDGLVTPVLFDMGYSDYLALDEKIDLFQIVRTTTPHNIGRENALYIRPILEKLYISKYGPFDKKLFREMHKRYQKAMRQRLQQNSLAQDPYHTSQDSAHHTSQDSAHRTSQDSAHRTSQDSAHRTSQDSAHRTSQDSSHHTSQDSAHHTSQDSAHHTSQSYADVHPTTDESQPVVFDARNPSTKNNRLQVRRMQAIHLVYDSTDEYNTRVFIPMSMEVIKDQSLQEQTRGAKLMVIVPRQQGSFVIRLSKKHQHTKVGDIWIQVTVE